MQEGLALKLHGQLDMAQLSTDITKQLATINGKFKIKLGVELDQASLDKLAKQLAWERILTTQN